MLPTMRRHSDMATSAAEEAAHDEWGRAEAADTNVKPKEPLWLPCAACVGSGVNVTAAEAVASS